jgi:hypothetical protein
MDRRKFLGIASGALLAACTRVASAPPPLHQAHGSWFADCSVRAPEERIRRVHDLGFSNCFLSLDG